MSTATDRSKSLPQLLLHGLDSLYACYYYDLVSSKLDFDELEYRKQLAKDRETSKAYFQFGEERIQVMPGGQKFYKYVLSNRDFKISIAERMQPSVKVQFFSEALWRDGARALHDRVIACLKAVGAAALKSEQVNRADWAFDFKLSVVDFHEDCFVSRARKNNKWRDRQKVQTFGFGVSDTVVRVYDKVAEIEQASDKAWFYDLWGQKADVWRVEFQVRSERLKKAAIRTMQDLEDFQGDLLKQLALTHTTLRRPNDDTNRARWPLHPLWKSLVAAIDAMPQFGLCRHYDPTNSLEYRYRKNSQGIYGYLKNLAALTSLRYPSKSILTLDEILKELPKAIGPFHSPTLWQAKVEERLRKYEVGQ
tara:strand:- start:5331 stop:6422 length:1092 start_codon:yes stop_codon:yes gene_type:complete